MTSVFVKFASYSSPNVLDGVQIWGSSRSVKQFDAVFNKPCFDAPKNVKRGVLFSEDKGLIKYVLHKREQMESGSCPRTSASRRRKPYHTWSDLKTHLKVFETVLCELNNIFTRNFSGCPNFMEKLLFSIAFSTA